MAIKRGRKRNSMTAAIWRERVQWVGEFIKNGLIGWLICFVAIGFLIASNIVIGGWNQQLQTKLAEVNSLAASLNDVLVRNQRATDSVKYQLTSIDLDRVAQDNSVYEPLVQKMFTWDNTTYRSVADEIDTRYDFDDTYVRFAQRSIREWYSRHPNDKTTIFWSEFVSYRSYVKSYAAETYVYVGEIETRQMDADQVEKTVRYVMTYAVQKDGAIRIDGLQKIVD